MTANLNVGQAQPDNKIKCHSKLDLESHRMLLSNNEILNQVQDDKRGGFTLIELLVVVLIIGILAAVALPQYQKAVEKAKATQAIGVLRSYAQAMHSYYLEHGTYPSQLSQLDVTTPWTGTQAFTQYNYTARSNQDWSLQLFTPANDKAHGILVGRLTGPYAGTGFMLLHDNTYSASDMPPNKLICREQREEGIIFNGDRGDYCQKLFNATRVNSSGWSQFYAFVMP